MLFEIKLFLFELSSAFGSFFFVPMLVLYLLGYIDLTLLTGEQ